VIIAVEQLQRFFSVGRGLNFIANTFQVPANGVPDQHGIVDHEDVARHKAPGVCNKLSASARTGKRVRHTKAARQYRYGTADGS
jgi:hypothetical protein